MPPSRRRSDAATEDAAQEERAMLARKVDNQTFVWAIGLLSSLLVAVALWCMNAIAGIRTDVSATNAKVTATDTRITTVVDTFNVNGQLTQATLSRIQTDVEWIKRQIDAAPVQPGRRQ